MAALMARSIPDQQKEPEGPLAPLGLSQGLVHAREDILWVITIAYARLFHLREGSFKFINRLQRWRIVLRVIFNPWGLLWRVPVPPETKAQACVGGGLLGHGAHPSAHSIPDTIDIRLHADGCVNDKHNVCLQCLKSSQINSGGGG